MHKTRTRYRAGNRLRPTRPHKTFPEDLSCAASCGHKTLHFSKKSCGRKVSAQDLTGNGLAFWESWWPGPGTQAIKRSHKTAQGRSQDPHKTRTRQHFSENQEIPQKTLSTRPRARPSAQDPRTRPRTGLRTRPQNVLCPQDRLAPTRHFVL